MIGKEIRVRAGGMVTEAWRAVWKTEATVLILCAALMLLQLLSTWKSNVAIIACMHQDRLSDMGIKMRAHFANGTTKRTPAQSTVPMALLSLRLRERRRLAQS